MTYTFHDGRIIANGQTVAVIICASPDFISQMIAALNRKPPGRKGYATEAERQAARRETMRRANAKRRKT